MFSWLGAGTSQARGAGAGELLEVVLADVLLREHDRWAEQDLVRREHLHLAEPTGLEGARFGQVTLDLGVSHVDREVPEIYGVPEDELLYNAGIDVRLHLVRGGETRHRHFPSAAHLFDRLSRARQGYGGYAEDAGRIGVGLEVVLGYVDALLEVLLPRLDGGYGHVRVLLLHALLHRLEPGNLVGGGERAGHDQELTLATGLLGHDVHQLVADGLEGRLVHEDLAGVLGHVGVPGPGLDAGVTGLLHRGGEGVGVVGGDRDGAALLLDPLLDHLRLERGLGLGRPVVDELDVQLPCRLLGPLLGGVEVRYADQLGHHADLGGTPATTSLGRTLLAHPASRNDQGQCYQQGHTGAPEPPRES